jgi:hypothetical protein
MDIKRLASKIVRSPKTVAIMKLGVAVIGVIHALDELSKASKANDLLKREDNS